MPPDKHIQNQACLWARVMVKLVSAGGWPLLAVSCPTTNASSSIVVSLSRDEQAPPSMGLADAHSTQQEDAIGHHPRS